MVRTWGGFFLAGAALTLLSHSAAGADALTVSRCRERVIVKLAPPLSPSDDRIAQAVARAAHVQLKFIRTIGSALSVFELTSSETDVDCAKSLQRLRLDARVRSVEIDARRQHHGN
ncbi:MAG: hypothetical protein ACHQAR_05445 [Steroidobacterales bacterium]